MSTANTVNVPVDIRMRADEIHSECAEAVLKGATTHTTQEVRDGIVTRMKMILLIMKAKGREDIVKLYEPAIPIVKKVDYDRATEEERDVVAISVAAAESFLRTL